jgi:type I restriction enzyme S subunit
MSSSMREDWIEVELGKVFNITYGKGLSTKDLLKEGYPVYGANGVIGYYSVYKYEERQVLISCRGAASGKINISPEKCFITNNSLIVESNSDFISKEYLYFILSGANRSKIVTGSAQPQVTINNANPLLIKLAPLPIQRAIVSKIEALFSDLDKGIANFKKAQEQLKIYRQAVLKKAFEGELTKEWREKQNNLPTAKELLKQIKEERQNHYDQQIEDWKIAVKLWEKNGKKVSKPSKPAQPKELPPLKHEGLEALPKEWNNLRIEYFLSLNKKGMTTGPFGTMLKKSEHKKDGIPVLGIENIGEGLFIMPNKIFVTPEKAKEL